MNTGYSCRIAFKSFDKTLIVKFNIPLSMQYDKMREIWYNSRMH